MKKFTFTMIAGLIAAGAAFAHAETLTITTGSKKGAYFEVGQKIASQFKGNEVLWTKVHSI